MTDHVTTSNVYVSGGDEEFSHEITTFSYRTERQLEEDEARHREMLAFLRNRGGPDLEAGFKRARTLRVPGTSRSFVDSAQYANWHSGESDTFACIGPAGTGKTVLSATVVQDLRNRYPHVLVLFAFGQNPAPQQSINTPRLFLHFLSQIVEQYPRHEYTQQLELLWKEYGSRKDILPPLEQIKAALCHELARFQRAFIVMDGLDRFFPNDIPVSEGSMQELNDLQASLFVTSRHPLPFSRAHECREARVSAVDIRALVNNAAKGGQLKQVLQGRPELLDLVCSTLSETSGGSFLLANLHLKLLSRSQTPFEIRGCLRNLPSDLSQTYDVLVQYVKDHNPWAIPLIHHLSIAEAAGHQVGARAMLQYLAACDALPYHILEDVEDHVRPIEVVLEACMGLVVLVDQENEEDKGAESSMHLAHRGFAFSHPSAAQHVGEALLPHLQEVKIKLVSVLLQYCSALYQPSSKPRQNQSSSNESPPPHLERNVLQQRYPLCFYAERWLVYAQDIQTQIPSSLIRAFFHQHLAKLLTLTTSWKHLPCHALDVQTILLSKHGLSILLENHLENAGTAQLDMNLNATSSTSKWFKRGWTALFWVVDKGHACASRVLLDHGADVDQMDDLGSTPLIRAVRRANREAVTLLLERGASKEKGQLDGATPLIIATKLGHEEIVLLLLESGVQVDEAQDSGWTALMWAAHDGRVALANILLKHGALAEHVAWKDKRTPLIAAVRASHLEVVRTLLQYGAPVDSAQMDSQTALTIASRLGSHDIAALLLTHGAAVDYTSQSEDGWTPLIYASSQGHEALVALLLEHGANPEKAELNSGWTPLIWAASKGFVGIVEVLLRFGANVDKVDLDGNTPLAWASKKGHGDVIALLLEHGASPIVDTKKQVPPQGDKEMGEDETVFCESPTPTVTSNSTRARGSRRPRPHSRVPTLTQTPTRRGSRLYLDSMSFFEAGRLLVGEQQEQVASTKPSPEDKTSSSPRHAESIKLAPPQPSRPEAQKIHQVPKPTSHLVIPSVPVLVRRLSSRSHSQGGGKQVTLFAQLGVHGPYHTLTPMVPAVTGLKPMEIFGVVALTACAVFWWGWVR